MTVSNTPFQVAAIFVFASCAHTEMTGDEHRAAAADDMAAAAPSTQTTFYKPGEANLADADRKMASAFAHLNAARKLERFENDACFGISTPERMSCPLIAPHLDKIEEGIRGVVLHFKSAQTTRTVGIQMRCHLAFAMANNFERTPCPLYLKGVVITLVGDKAIEVTSTDPNVTRAVREAARRMFGEPPNTVSRR